ncbi:hypothetical protein GF336_06505 [Candidatus Woesearchaeota archaeon]|nr:hypothetical protein [Candidatus Woesearchaeota archaeon]
MKKDYTVTIIAGILLIFLGIFFQVSDLARGMIPLIFMNAGTILIVIAVISHNRYGAGITQDERTRALGARALSNSWLLTFVLVNVLFWIDYTKVLTLSASHILGILLFTMTLSAGIIQSILKKRGIINED